MDNNETGNGKRERLSLVDVLKRIRFTRRGVRTLCLCVSGILVLIAVLTLTSHRSLPADSAVEEPGEPKMMYGIEYEQYEVEEKEVQSGETLSHMLEGYGVGQARINELAESAREVLNVRNINAGNKYVLFFDTDSLGSRRLAYFVYEKNVTDFVVVSFLGDEITATAGQKDIDIVRRKVTADISSSLWNCIVEHDLPYALSCEMEDVFGWSVDFFSLQDTDEFTVIYDEKYIDTLRVGIGRIWGAAFTHNGKVYYAIPFEQDGKISYWDENGNSLRKQLLKAPLKYTRISSRFSRSRLHPVLKIRRPHLGVDYAAPAGTPVVAIADGVVTKRGWDSGGGGNTLKLKHANNLQSAYLHLKGFAKGISVGSHVSQGQVIGYVGSTGLSTGPHLDFRLYKGGTAIDPLKAPSEPTEPIKAESREWFNSIRERVMAELAGEVDDSMKIELADLESFNPQPDSTAVVEETVLAEESGNADSVALDRKAARKAARENRKSKE